MKELLIVRHAKSDWNSDSLSDHDRPLNKRGLRDAPMMSSIVVEKFFRPDLIISSSANRALSTATYFAQEVFGDSSKIQIERRLYHASETEILNYLNLLDDKYQRVYLIAHNPGITYFANDIRSNEHIDNVPTCGIVYAVSDLKYWADLTFEDIELKKFIYPKMFK